MAALGLIVVTADAPLIAQTNRTQMPPLLLCSAARLAPQLLTARPAARAVCLNLSPESYLAALLRGADWPVDLNAHGTERTARLERRLGAPLPRPASPGELAALSWLAERLTQDEIGKTFGGRVLAVDVEAFLRMTGPWLARIAHLAVHRVLGMLAVFDAS